MPDPIEGLWQLSSEESVLGIRATSRGNYEIVAIDSPSPGLLPGTVIGTARASAKYGVYDASIYTELGADGGLSKGKDFIVELTDGGGHVHAEPLLPRDNYKAMAAVALPVPRCGGHT